MSLSELIARAPAALELAFGALKNPADDPVTALLAIAAIVAVFLIILLTWLFVVLSIRKPQERAPQAAPRSRTDRPKRTGVALAVCVVLIAGVVAGWHYSTTDEACGSCHYTADAIISNDEDTHADIRCRDCHVGPGAANGVLARARGGGNLIAQLTGASESEPRVAAAVGNEACLRCHAAVEDDVVVARGIRMRHSDVLAVGYACTDCHNTAGHGVTVGRARYPKMAQCVMCHDGTEAPAECQTCHSEDVGTASRWPSDLYAKAHVPTDSCRGCHPMDSCIACHGLELPHSQEFKDGYHARKGLLEPEICAKCHSPAKFCNGCHHFPINSDGSLGSGHGAALLPGQAHSPAKPDTVCSCHVHEPRTFCDYCHGEQPSR